MIHHSPEAYQVETCDNSMKSAVLSRFLFVQRGLIKPLCAVVSRMSSVLCVLNNALNGW